MRCDMQFVKGMIVRSKAGHDKGKFFAVVRIENGFAYLSDGKGRSLEFPKKKNLIHLAPTKTVLDMDNADVSAVCGSLAVFNSRVRSS